jgi:tetratricopeptide (TPR) repeat protein
VDLDPELAAAHVALGANNLFAFQWDAADLELQRAILLDPQTDGHTPYGYYLQAMGRPEEALNHLKRTAELSPEWQIAGDDLLWGLFFARRYEEAEAACRRAISLDPSNFAPYYMLGQTQAQTGKHREAVVTLEQGYRVADAFRQKEILAELGYVYAVMGDNAKALDTISRLRKVDDRFTHMLVARVYTGLGDKDRAFDSLDKAYEEHTPFLWEIRVMPQFDSLRSDPRYAALLRRMNLPL